MTDKELKPIDVSKYTVTESGNVIKDKLKQEAEKHADGIYHYKINVSDYGEDGIINYRYSDVEEAYLAGAEPREKRIAELEAQIAELKKQHDIVRDERNLFQERCEDILENYYCDHKCKCADLEKENAELKERLEHRNCVDCSNHGSNIKLLKAKSLLAKWVELYKPKLEVCPPTPIQVETEQFLNSEVEK